MVGVEMTDEEILKIAEEWLHCNCSVMEWYGKNEDIIKFALVMYNKGMCEGAYIQSKRYMEKNLK